MTDNRIDKIVADLLADESVVSFTINGAGGIAIVEARYSGGSNSSTVTHTTKEGSLLVERISSGLKKDRGDLIIELDALSFTQMQIARMLDISQPAVSKHLRSLN